MQPSVSLIVLMLFSAFIEVKAQTAPDTWWVQFTDKNNTPYSLDQPQEFLSARSIQRREVQGIQLDELDLPVDPMYIGAVLAFGEVQLVNRSKWFNAITVRTADSAVLEVIESLPFVLTVRSSRSLSIDRSFGDKFDITPYGGPKGGGEGDYGASFLQIAMMNGHLLHDLDARGQGMLIGVLDSGFEGADSLAAFDALRGRDGIIHTRDLVVGDGDVYADHWHGRSVLSCMAGIVDGQLIGTAPMADYILLRTEDTDSEFIVEEDNWVSGAELCDSLGVDVINSSLGYTIFDWTEQDHEYADMDGQTTRVSIACGIAASKGMIPVTSAGNSGTSDFHYISAPADAIDILAVGGVDAGGLSADFSSWGPSSDGRVKPDVAAMGFATIGLGVDGVEVVPINGTSFASPLVAGLVACLWQLHPERTAHDVMDAVRRSASKFAVPDDQMGYGIPEMMQAHRILEMTTGIERLAASPLQIFPNPFSAGLEVVLPQWARAGLRVEVRDMSGRLVWSFAEADGRSGRLLLGGEGIIGLSDGVYVLSVQGSGWRRSMPVIKAR